MKANIFDIYRGTTHDGPGLRTTIFFRGCPLCCAWCHNPEGISLQPYIWWDGSRCIGCGTCQKVCPKKAIQFTQDGLQIHPEQCSQCGLCLEHCPSKALEAVSRNYSLEEIQTDTNNHACDVDIYVVRPVLRNPGTDNPELYYLIMNDEPWTTNISGE